jgi:hypothetical protein
MKPCDNGQVTFLSIYKMSISFKLMFDFCHLRTVLFVKPQAAFVFYSFGQFNDHAIIIIY